MTTIQQDLEDKKRELLYATRNWPWATREKQFQYVKSKLWRA